MDVVMFVVLVIIIFIVFSLCGYCCKKNKQGVVYGDGVQPTITSTYTYATNTPYPPQENYIAGAAPTTTAPTAGFAPHAAYPPTTPYPVQNTPYPPQAAPYPTQDTPYPIAGALPPGYHPMPMPMSMPMPTLGGMPTPGGGMPTAGGGAAPYPTMPMAPGPYTSPVPPYQSQAAPSQLPPSYNEAVTNEVYAKQSAYNPNYQ